jgi:hypothetical protein
MGMSVGVKGTDDFRDGGAIQVVSALAAGFSPRHRHHARAWIVETRVQTVRQVLALTPGPYRSRY